MVERGGVEFRMKNNEIRIFVRRVDRNGE